MNLLRNDTKIVTVEKKETKSIMPYFFTFGSLLVAITGFLYGSNTAPFYLKWIMIGYLIFVLLYIPAIKLFKFFKKKLEQSLANRKYKKYKKDLYLKFNSFHEFIDTIISIDQGIKIEKEIYSLRNELWRNFNNWYKNVNDIVQLKNIASEFTIISEFLNNFHWAINCYYQFLKHSFNTNALSTQSNPFIMDDWNKFRDKYNSKISDWENFALKVLSETGGNMWCKFELIRGL